MNESRIGAETERGLDANSLWQLIAVRFREYMREPEALFWSFGFPSLLAIGLGIAFRSKPADLVHVAVVSNGPRSAPLAPENKCLAQSNKSRVEANATKKCGNQQAMATPPGMPRDAHTRLRRKAT